jgi:alpha-L-fucosidase
MAAMPRGEAWMDYAETHFRELVERYRPSVLWPDFGFPESDRWERLMAWYYDRIPEGVINDRFNPLDDVSEEEPSDDALLHNDFTTLESVTHRFELDTDGYADAPTAKKWESCRPMGKSWGYNRAERDETYSPATNLIWELAEVVARGGNLLLNVGPTGTGEIPWLQAQRLAAIGLWLTRYGSAIYGTRPWDSPTGITAEGLHIRYTADDGAVHAIILGTPAAAEVTLDLRLDPNAAVFLEDQPVPLAWESTDGGVRVRLPEPPDEQPAIALRLTPRTAVHSS